MRKCIATLLLAISAHQVMAQGPEITSWIRNTTGITGRHYVSGSSTPINDSYLANVQKVEYSTNYVYVHCTGIPAYIIGPYLDGNPNQGADNHNIYKIPRTATANTGTPETTQLGTMGVFINGVSLFDYRDGVSWKNSSSSEAGGPIPGGPGDGVWNRDAIVAERAGFDCAKGHPAGTNYHHHQNPSAFNLDRVVISTICNTYLADGLYVIDTANHSPLLGYAYDGFPIYGAYAYKNTDGTGGIARMKSSYQLRAITTRTTYADGTDVIDGPPVSTAYPLGRYKEDYEYVAHTEPDYLDEHNGRFCITPEYPAGTYCYFTTVDANHNSTYPYCIGPTFYGKKVITLVSSVTEATTEYTGSTGVEQLTSNNFSIKSYPNPVGDLLLLQSNELMKNTVTVSITNMAGQTVATEHFLQGTTICYIQTSTLYGGNYIVTLSAEDWKKSMTITIAH